MTPVVDREDLEAAVEKLRAGVVRRWEPYGDARAFLADHRPFVWDKVRRCGLTRIATAEQAADPDRVKVWSRRCDQVPWCLECVHRQHFRRVQRVFERWAKCTPEGELPRFSHIVITAPHFFEYDADGNETTRVAPNAWGIAASRNPKAFSQVIWNVLTEIYGQGLGAHMSYQDFGERGFGKLHPHIDLTLNGYTVKDGRVGELPYFELSGGGYDELVGIVEKHANALQLGARGSNIFIGAVMEGFGAYQKILSYQVREMIDLRKMRYDRKSQMVGWESYKEPYETTWLPTRRWLAGFEEYCARLGVFNGTSGRKLHFDYGHMAANRIRATQAVTGGKPEPHPEGCPCSHCGEWRRVYLLGGVLEDWHRLASPYDA